jgi:hypothetical protein
MSTFSISNLFAVSWLPCTRFTHSDGFKSTAAFTRPFSQAPAYFTIHELKSFTTSSIYGYGSTRDPTIGTASILLVVEGEALKLEEKLLCRCGDGVCLNTQCDYSYADL